MQIAPEPEIPIGEIELVNASKRRTRKFEEEQRQLRRFERHRRIRENVERWGVEEGIHVGIGDPFEPIPDLITRAEQFAKQQWQREHG